MLGVWVSPIRDSGSASLGYHYAPKPVKVRVDDIYLKDPKAMGTMVYSLLWVMQGLYHQQ